MSLGFGGVLPSLSKTSPALGDFYVVLGVCFALLGAGFAIDGFLRYRRFIDTLDMSFARISEAARWSALRSPASLSRYSAWQLR